MAKPTNLALWATGGGAQIDEPTTLEKQTGWIPAGQPPAEWFNWWMNAVYLWVVWLDAFESTVHTWTAAQTFNALTTFVGNADFEGDAVFEGAAEFQAGASMLDDVEFDGGKSVFSAGALRITALGNTGGDGFDAAGELHLKAGTAGAGSLILKAKKLLLEGVGEEDDAIRIDLGASAGPDRSRIYVINGTVWLVWNALFSDVDQTWGRIAAGDAYALAFGKDATATTGLPESIKILRRGGDETDDWDSYGANGWWPMGMGSGSSAGPTGAPIARMLPVAPTLGNNFVNSALTGVEVVGYWKDHFGTVHLQGVLKLGSGSSGNPAFTLPAPFCPAYHRYFVNRGVTATGNTVLVKPDGTVNVYGVSGDEVTLEGLQFN